MGNRNNSVNTELQKASGRGNAVGVQTLLSAGADVDEKGHHWRTALHFATSKGHIGVMRMLLAAGANVNENGKNGKNALHEATMLCSC